MSNGTGADTKIDMGVTAMKVIPLYTNYSKIKSAIERIRKEPQMAQMSTMDILNAIQKQFDSRDVDIIQARDLKIRNTPGGRVVDLNYNDEREVFDGSGLFVLLKVKEEIPLTPKEK